MRKANLFQLFKLALSKLRATFTSKARRVGHWIPFSFGLAKIRIVYCLTSSGNDLYEAMTLVSIFTVRHTNPSAHITIVCDHQTHTALLASDSPLLVEADQIHNAMTPEGSDGYRNRFLKTKLALLIEGPFLFLDSDTVVRKSLNRLRFLRADIAAAPNHSRDKIKEQIWDEDQAHLQKMDWQVKPPFLNAGVIWYGGTPASLHISQTWHLHWLDSVRRTSRWRDQTAFNHTITQAKDLSIHYLGHEWNAQYWANRSTSSGARIWHTYATAGSMAERQNELFFMACQQVLSGAEGGLNADSAVIKALVNHPSPFTS